VSLAFLYFSADGSVMQI